MSISNSEGIFPDDISSTVLQSNYKFEQQVSVNKFQVIREPSELRSTEQLDKGFIVGESNVDEDDDHEESSDMLQETG